MGGPQEIGEIRSIRQEFLGICHDPGRNGRDDAVDRSDRRRQGGHVRARRRGGGDRTARWDSGCPSRQDPPVQRRELLRDRKSVGEGKSVSVRIDLVGRSVIKKNNTKNKQYYK